MYKVAQLVKLAKDKKMSKDDRSNAKLNAAAAAGGSAYLGSKAPARLLGYHNVYHGTAKRKDAENIRKTGLKTSKGGSGVSAVDDAIKNAGTSDNVARSKNRIYFSKSKNYAAHYAQGDRKNVIKGRMPHNQYRKAYGDKLVKKLGEQQGVKMSDKKLKRMAALSSHGIKPGQIAGGKGDKGIKQFASKKNMKRYLSSGSGKKRFVKGIASAAGSAGLAAYSGKKVKQLVNDSRSKKK